MKERKTDAMNIAIFIMLIVLTTISISLFFKFNGDTKECLKDPIQYGVDKMDIPCICVNKQGIGQIIYPKDDGSTAYELITKELNVQERGREGYELITTP